MAAGGQWDSLQPESIDAAYMLAVMNSTLMDGFYRSTFPSWGDPWENLQKTEREIDRIVYALFGPTEEEIGMVEGEQ